MRFGVVVEAEGAAELVEQAGLAGALGELAAERLARVLQGMLDQLALLAALRRGDLDAMAGAGGQRLFQKLALGDVVAEQDQARAGLVLVELGQKRLQHLARLQGAVGAGIERVVAPVLAGAEEEHLHAGRPAFLMDGEDVRLLHRARVDPLSALHGGERGEAVAQGGGALEFQFLRRLLHFPRKLLLHRPALAGQEVARLAHIFGVVGVVDLAGAGPAQRLIWNSRHGRVRAS